MLLLSWQQGYLCIIDAYFSFFSMLLSGDRVRGALKWSGETPSPMHMLISPPDLLPLRWYLADLVQVPATALSPAFHLAGTSDSRKECGDITRRCRHPFQRRLISTESRPCHGPKCHLPSCLYSPDPLLNSICNVCFINTAVQLFNSQATKETG